MVVVTTNSVACALALLGSVDAGAVFVPVNAKLDVDRMLAVVQDCGARFVVVAAGNTRGEKLQSHLDGIRQHWRSAADEIEWHIVKISETDARAATDQFLQPDAQAIFYTSGSSGSAKGVLVSSDNLLRGASAVAGYLNLDRTDVLLGLLPMSFDAGFSQVSTALRAGASVAFIDYLLPNDVPTAVQRFGVTSITAVPPLWQLISRASWPQSIGSMVKSFASTGGKMHKTTLDSLRTLLPQATPFLMYGLTEGFRATYLNPQHVDTHPNSIGKAIPDVEVLVMADSSKPCPVGEVGELVQTGPLVALGYWGADVRSYARFEPAPDCARYQGRSVWSGDLVSQDADGFLYFEGRRDGMIKIMGHRVSLLHIETECLHLEPVLECCVLSQEQAGITVLVALLVLKPSVEDAAAAPAAIRESLAAKLTTYEVPEQIWIVETLPRDFNGKLDRSACAELINAVELDPEGADGKHTAA